jgi:putative PIN family toxin of toxin-antitoxin system
MRLVLDTNVLIAALIARGVCMDLLEHCVLNHSLVTSEFILRELREHLVSKFAFSAEEADEAVAVLASQMEIVVPAALSEPVCRDPEDDAILATAVAGRAQSIVTGDKDLLVLVRFGEIVIVAPAAFSDIEKNE